MIRSCLVCAIVTAFAVFAASASADGVYWSSPAQDNTYVNDTGDIPSFAWSFIGEIEDADCAFVRVTPSPSTLTSNDCFTPGPNVPTVDNSMAPESFGFTWDIASLVSGDGTYRVEGNSFFLNIDPAFFDRTFTLDTVDPLVTVTAPLGWTNDSTPAVGFSITDANPGTTRCGYDATGPDDSSALSVCPSSPPDLPALSDGSHTFWAVHTDLAGNSASATKTFDVDATAPSITVTGVAQGQVLEQAIMGVAVSANDPGSGLAALSCAWDAGALGSCVTSDFTSAILADGSHALTVVATDQLGNTNTQTISFSVDTTAGIKQGLIAPKAGAFKIKRGKLKRGKYGATFTTTFATPAGGDAKSCGGTASTRILLKKKQLGSSKVKFKAAGAKCVGTSTFKLSKKYKGKKLTLILDYKNGPIKAFRLTSKSLKF